LKGIVSKKRNAPYRSGPSHAWLTIKTTAWREAKRERRQWSEARAERTALRTDVTALKAESKTHSELLGKVSALVVEIYHGQDVVSETARHMEERVFRLEKHAGFVKVH